MTRQSSVALVLFCVCVLPACPKHPEPGLILVGEPEVYTRERLVNDRLANDEWLRNQLARAETLRDEDFGYQGLNDVRSFTGVFSQTGVQADPNLTSLYGAETANALGELSRKEEAAQLEHQIRMAKLTAQLRELESDDSQPSEAGVGTVGEASDGETESNGADKPPSAPFSAPDSSLLDKFLADLQNPEKSLLPDPKAATKTKAVGSPIDYFRDRLALREEIRSEIFENMLDDRHDVAGGTIYRLNFDATLIPNADDDRWAIIEVSDFDPKTNDHLYSRWKKHFVRQLNELWRETVRQVVRGRVPEDRYRHLVAYYDEKVRDGVQVETCFGGSGRDTTKESANRPQLKDIITRLRLCGYDREGVARPSDNDSHSHVPPDSAAFDTDRGAIQWLVFHQLKNEYIHDRGFESYLKVQQQLPFADRCPEASSASDCLGLEQAFKGRIKEAEKPYPYAATPKESVQRISDVLASRKATQIALNLGLMLGVAKIDQVTRYVSETQEILHSVERQPLIVGFAAGDTALRRAGWLIGPKFNPQKKGSNYSHSPIQNTISLLLSIPGWSASLEFKQRTCWRSKHDKARGQSETSAADSGFNGHSCPPPVVTRSVKLAENLASVTDLLDEERVPIVFSHQWVTATFGQPLRMLIPGTDLWRSTRVTLGPQIADRVVVLPGMAGIAVEFDQVAVRANRDGSPARELVYVWTSTGRAEVARVSIHPALADDGTTVLELLSKRLIAERPVRFRLSMGKLPTGFFRLALGAREKQTDGQFSAWEYRDISTPAIAGDVLTETLWTPKNFRDGSEAQVGVFLQLTKQSDLVPLTPMKTRTYYASQTTASIRAPGMTAKLDLRKPLVFQFPKRVAEAYPGFSPSSIRVRLEVQMAPGESMKPVLNYVTELGSWDSDKRTLSGTIELVDVSHAQFAAARNNATLTVRVDTGNEHLSYRAEQKLEEP